MPSPDAFSLARDVLVRARGWSLPEGRWARVREAVRALDSAVRADDPAAIRHAVNWIELIGPRLANSMDGPVIPMPPEVREEIVVVLDELPAADPGTDE